MSEDAMIERTAREEQDELDRTHGQHILDVAAAQGAVRTRSSSFCGKLIRPRPTNNDH